MSRQSLLLQNWWYTSLLHTNTDECPPLTEHIVCDTVVVGGGMAGLHAAQLLAEAGQSVVLLERNICGGSSTGKSAGFLTPDSELELHQLIRRYGIEGGKAVWSMATEGIARIVDNIQTHALECDLQEQQSLFLGIGRGGQHAVHEEEATRSSVGYDSIVYDARSLCDIIHHTHAYRAGIRYDGTYGINPLLYAQELKHVLLQKGVRIYESTAMVDIVGHTVNSHLGSVEAREIILCVDKLEYNVSSVADDVYHAQTFLSISEPLSKEEVDELFPKGPLLCWDSQLVYSYFRLTGDRRLLLGGGSALTTFLPHDVTSPRVIEAVIADFKRRFPFLKHHAFIQYWPGRIDTTRDLVPIVDRDPHRPYIQYVLGCVGLPWATFCGDYAARKILDPDLRSHDLFLRIDRPFFFPSLAQRFFGKMIAFSLNNIWSKYIQKDVVGSPRRP